MPEVQKKVSDQGSVGLSFEYFWLRGCGEFSRPILKQDKTKPKQSRLKQEFLSSDNSINLQVSICLKMSFVFIDLLSRIINQIMECTLTQIMFPCYMTKYLQITFIR